MKKLNVKSMVATFAVIATVSFSNVSIAEETVLPVISKPSILEEGTQRELTTAQIAELLPWAKDSKVFLLDLLENVETLTPSNQVEHLVDGIKSIVGESAPKNTELLMRYSLNRGLVLNDILTSEVEVDSVGLVDVKLRVLRASIQMAVKYYDKDMEVLAKKSQTSFAAFGIDYYDFLSELNKSIFDASAQYSVQRTALEFLQWDLYRDLNNTMYAPQIVKINNGLKVFPNRKLTDAHAIGLIRQMKSLARQLKLSSEGNSNYNYSVNVNSNQEFETLMAKKKLVDTIANGVKYATEAMRYVNTIDQFFQAISPEMVNASEEYKSSLATVGYNNRKVLINMSQTEAKDIKRLNVLSNDISQIIQVTKDYLPRVKTSKEFLVLFEFTVANPSDAYKTALRALVMESMGTFMSLNPTQKEKDTLLARF